MLNHASRWPYPSFPHPRETHAPHQTIERDGGYSSSSERAGEGFPTDLIRCLSPPLFVDEVVIALPRGERAGAVRLSRHIAAALPTPPPSIPPILWPPLSKGRSVAMEEERAFCLPHSPTNACTRARSACSIVRHSLHVKIFKLSNRVTNLWAD